MLQQPACNVLSLATVSQAAVSKKSGFGIGAVIVVGFRPVCSIAIPIATAMPIPAPTPGTRLRIYATGAG